MAKHTHDREDLLRDASVYVQRVEFLTAAGGIPIFFGFRDCGAASVYFGQDNVLQFNAKSELRRAFWRDRMMASYRRTPYWLDRRNKRQVRLTRTPLSEQESREFQSAARRWLQHLTHGITEQSLVVSGQVPVASNVAGKVLDWLKQQEEAFLFAMHPGLASRNRKT